jgi:hypothetical protein
MSSKSAAAAAGVLKANRVRNPKPQTRTTQKAHFQIPKYVCSEIHTQKEHKSNQTSILFSSTRKTTENYSLIQNGLSHFGSCSLHFVFYLN